jgi:hypothetical protein
MPANIQEREYSGKSCEYVPCYKSHRPPQWDSSRGGNIPREDVGSARYFEQPRERCLVADEFMADEPISATEFFAYFPKLIGLVLGQGI